jgi:prevent-host-death family protein
MSITNIHEAKSRLSKLVEQAERGEEVIIARAGKPVARLVPYGADSEEPRQGGQWKGRIRFAEDFDSLPADIAEALGITARE